MPGGGRTLNGALQKMVPTVCRSIRLSSDSYYGGRRNAESVRPKEVPNE